MLISLLVGSAASGIAAESIIAGATLGTTIYCTGRNICQSTGSKRK